MNPDGRRFGSLPSFLGGLADLVTEISLRPMLARFLFGRHRRRLVLVVLGLILAAACVVDGRTLAPSVRAETARVAGTLLAVSVPFIVLLYFVANRKVPREKRLGHAYIILTEASGYALWIGWSGVAVTLGLLPFGVGPVSSEILIKTLVLSLALALPAAAFRSLLGAFAAPYCEIEGPCTVWVVVDPFFGERLAGLPPNEPVWIVDSAANTPVAHRLWKDRPTGCGLAGITTFRPGSGYNPEQELISQLGTIDLHHGEFSADPPCSALVVTGCGATEAVRYALSGYGFRVKSVQQNGFLARRDGNPISTGSVV